MPDDILWRHEIELKELGIDVPEWIRPDIDTRELGAILQGGCASGAYMPAVTWTEAVRTMGRDGVQVVDYVQDNLGTATAAPAGRWHDICSWWLVQAVELWCSSVQYDAVEALKWREARAADAESASLEELEAAEEILRRAEEES
jgi:hypothetical protein